MNYLGEKSGEFSDWRSRVVWVIWTHEKEVQEKRQGQLGRKS